MSTAVPVRRSGLTRWAALGGVAYVVLFIVGSILLNTGQPDFDAPPAEVTEYFSDSGNRDKVGFGWALILLGDFFFLWFLAALWQFMRRVDADGLLTTLVLVGGTVYAALTLAGAGLQSAILTMSDDTFQDQVFPELIHAARDAGYVIHSSGGAGAAALIIAASLAAMRARLVPGALGVLGVIIGVLALASIAFLPQFAIALWILVASGLLFAAGARPREALPGPD